MGNLAGFCRISIPNFVLMAKSLYNAIKGQGEIIQRNRKAGSAAKKATLHEQVIRALIPGRKINMKPPQYSEKED